jgi:hypothetical protein
MDGTEVIVLLVKDMDGCQLKMSRWRNELKDGKFARNIIPRLEFEGDLNVIKD